MTNIYSTYVFLYKAIFHASIFFRSTGTLDQKGFNP